jgi:hypothetical protein
LPDITSAVSISGPGPARLVVNGKNGNFQFRVFNVTTTGTVSFSGITILNGAIDSTRGGGGAVQNVNRGTVNITNCTLRENGVTQVSTATAATGGAIYNPSGTVNVTNSTLSSNYAATIVVDVDDLRGAIYNGTGTIHVSNSTFYHNEADGGGGGIFNSGGIVTVTRSTFYQNGATFGGGIFSGGTVSVTNSTFYANIAHRLRYRFGGAIYNAGTMNFTNSTVTANFSNIAGSGVYNETGATSNVKSTIIALNYGGTSDTIAAPDAYGAFTSAGFNLIGKKDGSTGFSAATDKKGTIKAPLDPKLDPRGLRSNGGLTQRIALMAGSPAIDAGTSVGLTGKLTTDQRGQPRTFDNTSVTNASGGDSTDIGAYERETQSIAEILTDARRPCRW